MKTNLHQHRLKLKEAKDKIIEDVNNLDDDLRQEIYKDIDFKNSNIPNLESPHIDKISKIRGDIRRLSDNYRKIKEELFNFIFSPCLCSEGSRPTLARDDDYQGMVRHFFVKCNLCNNKSELITVRLGKVMPGFFYPGEEASLDRFNHGFIIKMRSIWDKRLKHQREYQDWINTLN